MYGIKIHEKTTGNKSVVSESSLDMDVGLDLRYRKHPPARIKATSVATSWGSVGR